ncbi:tetratricopeptide repeat protein, partial [Chloroflexota bacterium]
DDEQAIVAYGQAIVSEPDNAMAYFNRGSLYLLRENKAEAIADFGKVIEISDDDNMVEMAQDRISELNDQEWD